MSLVGIGRVVLREAQVKFRRPGNWLTDASARRSHLTFLISNLYEFGDDVHASIVVLGASADDVQGLTKEWMANEDVRRIEGPHEDPRGVRFQVVYDKTHSAYPIVIKHDAYDFSFSSVVNGFAYITVLAESKDLEEILKDLGRFGTVTILSIRAVSAAKRAPADEGGAAWAKLTSLQLAALVRAFDGHYYSWPRKVTTQELARSMGLATSAYLHHLRKAEDIVMSAVIEELKRKDESRLESARAASQSRRAKPARSRKTD